MNVDELVDRAEIHDVLVRYSRGLDRVDMALVKMPSTTTLGSTFRTRFMSVR